LSMMLLRHTKRFYRMVQYFIIINCQFIQIVNGYMCLQ